jgi:signal transduction histidine kinase
VKERNAADQIEELTKELLVAESRQRNALAARIHDDLQPLLLASKMCVAYNVRPRNYAQNLEKLNALLEESIQVSRTLTNEVFPAGLHMEDVASSLKWLVRWVHDKHGLAVDLEVNGRIPKLGEPNRFLFFYSARELLLNVVKHAGVDRALLTASCDEFGRIELLVRDEGCGVDGILDSSSHAESPSGFGLLNIDRQARRLGGTLQVTNNLLRGTSCIVKIPILSRTSHPSHRGGIETEAYSP